MKLLTVITKRQKKKGKQSKNRLVETTPHSVEQEFKKNTLYLVSKIVKDKFHFSN